MEKLDPTKYNLLNDNIVLDMDEFHTSVYQIFNISPNPVDGDVYVSGYKDKKVVYSISGNVVKRMLSASGAIVEPKTSEINGDPDMIKAEGRALFKTSAGLQPSPPEIYVLDVKALLADEENKIVRKNSKSNNPISEDEIKKKMKDRELQIRRFRYQIAQTGLYTRLSKMILGLNSGYFLEDIKKPFVVYKLILDFNNETVKEIIKKRVSKSEEEIYPLKSIEIFDTPLPKDIEVPILEEPNEIPSST